MFDEIQQNVPRATYGILMNHTGLPFPRNNLAALSASDHNFWIIQIDL